MKSETWPCGRLRQRKIRLALIEGSVQKIKLGSDIVSETNEAFSEVAESSLKVGDLVSEISAASSEQSKGNRTGQYGRRRNGQGCSKQCCQC